MPPHAAAGRFGELQVGGFAAHHPKPTHAAAQDSDLRHREYGIEDQAHVDIPLEKHGEDPLKKFSFRGTFPVLT